LRKRCTTIEILVGRIGRAHGIRGDVVIHVRTDEPDRRFAGGSSFGTARGRLTVASTHWHGSQLLVRFAGVADRTAAEALRGVELRIEVPENETPDDPEEYYDHQLIGLRVRVDEGADLGVVTDVLHLPAQDLLVLDVVGREVLVPFVSELVPVVDLDAGVVTVRPRPGLLDPDSEGS
jgi:16S rRNA processing protein RimM